ncbi:MAG: hypothetical protein ACNA8W_04090 [Bradymonadaceae bacterium]
MAAALVLMAALVVPAFCATATAQTLDISGEDHPCSQAMVEENCNEAEVDHCCGEKQSTQLETVISSSDEEEQLQGPTSWWSPDLLVALWLIDRLARSTPIAFPVEASPPILRPDRSNTYLIHSTLLI